MQTVVVTIPKSKGGAPMDITITIPTDPTVAAMQQQLQQQLTELAVKVAKLETPPVVVVVPPPVVIPPPPRYDEWKPLILQYADMHAAGLDDCSQSAAELLDRCYYDAAWIYHNLAAYFARPDYLAARDEAIRIYRDTYVLAQDTPGKAAGWMIFPHGLYWHYQDTHDERSKQAVLLMADHAAFSSLGEIQQWCPPLSVSRESAYNLMCKLYARDLGGTPVGIEELKAICLGHLSKWRAILDGSNATPISTPDGTLEDVRPFMCGLTCQALIEYDRRTPSPDIKAAITDTLNLMWAKMAVPASMSMQYDDRDIPTVGNTAPAPDLNMLIAPAYAWIGQRDRADLLFEGSVAGAYLTGHKQFNQSVRWVWDYLTWRVL